MPLAMSWPQLVLRMNRDVGLGVGGEAAVTSPPLCTQLRAQRLRTKAGLSAASPSPGLNTAVKGKDQFGNKHSKAS